MKLAPDAPTGLGAAMAGGKRPAVKTPRRDFDYYQTPVECTAAFLLAERDHMIRHGMAVWEPCAHGGAIVAPLRADGFRVIATDLRPDKAHGVTGLNLLRATALLAPIVVANFPFAVAAAMIDHLLGDLRVPYLAMLGKTQFWSTCTDSGRGRLGLYRRHAPNMRWDMNWRVDFTGQRNSTMNVSWFVWDQNRADQRSWGLLDRTGPVEHAQVILKEVQ